MSILGLAFPPELKSKIGALPVFAHLFIYREKIGKLYGTSGLTSGVRNLRLERLVGSTSPVVARKATSKANSEDQSGCEKKKSAIFTLLNACPMKCSAYFIGAAMSGPPKEDLTG